MGSTLCIQACRHAQDHLLKFKPSLGMRKNEFRQNDPKKTACKKGPHKLPVLSCKNRKLRLQFTRAPQIEQQKAGKMLPGMMGDDVHCNIQMVGSECGIKHESLEPSCLAWIQAIFSLNYSSGFFSHLQILLKMRQENREKDAANGHRSEQTPGHSIWPCGMWLPVQPLS